MRMLVMGDAAQPHLGRWIHALQRAGVEAEALSYEPSPAPVSCPLHALPAGAPRFLRAATAFGTALEAARKFRPDALSALFVPDYGVLAARLARALGADSGRKVPLVVAALGSDLLRNAWRTPLHIARARWVLARADRIAVDADMLARAARRLGAAPARLVRLDWLPDLSRFALRVEKPAGPLRIVSTRQHAPVYDLDTLLRAAVILRRKRSDFELVIAGDGPLRAKLEGRAKPLGGAVRFTGRLEPDALAELLGSATAYVSTSLSDSTSVSLLEAMACGAFPVVTDIDGNREWVEEGSSGLLFPAGSAQDLAAKLARALEDAVLRERAAAFNRRRLERLTPFEQGIANLVRAL